MLKKIKFEKEAIDYLQSCLRDSEKALSSCLLELPLEKGEVSAFLPVSSDPLARANFRYGGIAKRNETRAMLVEFIFKYLDTVKDGCLVLEHVLALPNDPWLLKKHPPFFFYKNTVCLFLRSDNSSKEAITHVLRDASNAYLNIGILTCLNQNIHIAIGQEVGLSILAPLAENSQCIFVSAYDGESDLIWTKEGFYKNS